MANEEKEGSKEEESKWQQGNFGIVFFESNHHIQSLQRAAGGGVILEPVHSSQATAIYCVPAMLTVWFLLVFNPKSQQSLEIITFSTDQM